jgi:hypothetical protein
MQEEEAEGGVGKRGGMRKRGRSGACWLEMRQVTDLHVRLPAEVTGERGTRSENMRNEWMDALNVQASFCGVVPC